MPYKPEAPASASPIATNTPDNTPSAPKEWNALAGASGL